MLHCPHCSEHDSFEEVTEEELKKIPKSWTNGQVGPREVIKRCKECKRYVTINERAETIQPIGFRGQYA